MRKYHKHHRPTPRGPNILDRDYRAVLREKSLKCFGKQDKWRLLADKLGLDVASIETQMDAIIKARELQIEEYNRRMSGDTNSKEVRPGETTTSTDAVGSNE